MKKLKILIALMACCVMVVNAVTAHVDAGEKYARIEAQTADAKLRFSKGDNSVFKPGSDAKWRNGIDECVVVECLNNRDRVDHLGFNLEPGVEFEESKHYYEVKMTKAAPCVINHRGVTVEHLVAGQWDMLVFLDRHGAVLDIALRSDRPDEQGEDDLRDMINGVYVGTAVTNAKDTVDFGAIDGSSDHRLPGAGYPLQCRDYETGQLYDRLLVTYFPDRMKRVHMPVISTRVDDQGVTHYYGDGKEISRGEYEHIASRPTGYGGHASLHGPLLWWVKPQGSQLEVELFQPFEEELDAFYSNYRDPRFTLKWVRSAYKNLSQRWAVLSMRPVTRGMLSVFDNETLRQMFAYLNDCKAPTDIETLNKSLIGNMLGVSVSTIKAVKKTAQQSKSKKTRRKK